MSLWWTGGYLDLLTKIPLICVTVRAFFPLKRKKIWTRAIRTGVIDERTECLHRGQEVDPTGEDWGEVSLSRGNPIHPSTIPLPAQPLRRRALSFSVFVWQIRWPLPLSLHPHPLQSLLCSDFRHSAKIAHVFVLFLFFMTKIKKH